MSNLEFLELLIAFCIIFIITPQTPTDNVILRKLFETGLFANYPQAKKLLFFVTWGLVFIFLLLLIFFELKF